MYANCNFAENTEKRKTMTILCKTIAATAIFLLPLQSIARTPAQQYSDRIASTELRTASLGVLALTADGDTIVSINSDRLLMPASNMKLVTTGLALHVLGKDFRYRTSLAYSGEITGGVLKGNLYIKGGGDPTLASDDPAAMRQEELFEEWTKILKDNGIHSIEGYIVGDDRYFSSMPEVRSWQLDDCGTYYGTGTSGLTFYENMQTFKVSAGIEVGDSISITPSWPDCPWMRFDFSQCSTGEPGTGDKLYYYTSRYAPFGEMRGTFAVDRSPKTLECSNKFPAYTCARLFCEYLGSEGIECTGGAADTGFFRPEGISPEENISGILGGTLSPDMGDIAFSTNYESNNLYAETLYLTLGKELYGDDRSAHRAMISALAELSAAAGSEKPDGGDVSITDGSGLSRQNLLSPSFLCAFLNAMKKSPEYGTFVESLPYPGSEGTMTGVMTDFGQEYKSRIKLKSGSMTGVRCFSGYVIPADGDISGAAVFSIMINNSTLSQYRMQKIADRLMYLIAVSVE